MDLIKASLMMAVGGGSSPNLQSITITQNDRYRAGISPYEGIDGWNDITVAVPQKTEIEGWFSSNGDYSPDTGKVWNLIHINVPSEDYTMPADKTSAEVEEFTKGDPPIWHDVDLTWQVVRIPQDGSPHTYTFAGETITAYCGVIVYTWANGVPLKMSRQYWSYNNTSYRLDTIGGFEVIPASGSTPPQFKWTMNYYTSVTGDTTTTNTFTLQKDGVNLNVNAMSDGTGWQVSNV